MLSPEIKSDMLLYLLERPMAGFSLYSAKVVTVVTLYADHTFNSMFCLFCFFLIINNKHLI